MTDPSTLDDVAQKFVDAIDDYVELEPEAISSETQLIINWGIQGFGFGQLSFFDRDGVIECDNECMSRATCLRILKAFAESMPAEDWPPMLKRFRGIASLLDAAVPTVPGPDWRGPA